MRLITAAVVLSLVADLALLSRFRRYEGETARLRTDMTAQQRARADLVVGAERHRLRVEAELIRRQARGDRQLNLAIHVDSGHAVLEREGVTLRSMPAVIGLERLPAGSADSTVLVAALGQRTVARVVRPTEAWDVPAAVYRDRGLPVPDERWRLGLLDLPAIELNDRTIVYAAPDSGVLADTAHAVPGSVRIPRADLRAIIGSVRPGMPVYFYR